MQEFTTFYAPGNGASVKTARLDRPKCRFVPMARRTAEDYDRARPSGLFRPVWQPVTEGDR